MNYCTTLLSSDIFANCNNPIVGGLERRGIIINRSDIDFGKTKFDEDYPNVISTLALLPNKRGFVIDIPANKPFAGTKTTLEEGSIRNSFTHEIGILVLDNNPQICLSVIDALATGKFVVILENTYKNTNRQNQAGNNAYQVYGFYQGLRASTLENDKYSEETDGGWNILLKESRTPKSALFLFCKDFETTKQLFESLSNTD